MDGWYLHLLGRNFKNCDLWLNGISFIARPPSLLGADSIESLSCSHKEWRDEGTSRPLGQCCIFGRRWVRSSQMALLEYLVVSQGCGFGGHLSSPQVCTSPSFPAPGWCPKAMYSSIQKPYFPLPVLGTNLFHKALFLQEDQEEEPKNWL